MTAADVRREAALADLADALDEQEAGESLCDGVCSDACSPLHERVDEAEDGVFAEFIATGIFGVAEAKRDAELAILALYE